MMFDSNHFQDKRSRSNRYSDRTWLCNLIQRHSLS